MSRFLQKKSFFEKFFIFLKKGVDKVEVLCYNIKLHYNYRYKGVTMPFGNFYTDIIYSDNFGGPPVLRCLTAARTHLGME